MARVSKKTRTPWSTRSRYAKPASMPPIGAEVKAQMKEIDLGVVAVAKRLNVSPQRVYRLLENTDWRISDLMNFSSLTGINLFEWLARQTGSPDLLTPQQAELDRLRAENQTLQTRLETLELALRLVGGR